VELAIFLTSLKPLIEGLSKKCPQEILVKIFDFLDSNFSGMKESLLVRFAKNYTDDNKVKLWNKVISIYTDILHPLEEAKKLSKSNAMQEESQKLNFALKQYQMNKGTSELYWPKPMAITYIQQKIANDVATINCKIGPMEIPYAMIDSGSNTSVISDNIVERLGLKIDKNTKYQISGYATDAYTIGMVYDIPITIGNENDSITESDEFCVVIAEKDKNGKKKSLLVLGTPLLHRLGWEPLVKEEFKIINNGRTLSVPLSIHKSNRISNGFNIEKNSSFGSETKSTSFGIKKT
jgi:hypothetical protein